MNSSIQMICFNTSSICYSSRNEISSRITDIGNVFILPSVNIASLTFNILCVIVFSNKKMTGEVNELSLLISLADVIFSIICAFLVLARCGNFCSFSNSFSIKVYEQFIYLFFGCLHYIYNYEKQLSGVYKDIIIFSKNKEEKLIFN